MAPVLRVFIDANILISGLCFDGPPRRLLLAAHNRQIALILAEYVIREAEAVITKKMPDRKADFKDLIELLPFESISLPSKMMVLRHRKYVTRDEDAAVLASAVLADADYVVSGDKQFNNKATAEMVD